MRSSKASAENMVLKIVGNLDFKPSESAIDRATSYVEGLLKKSGDLFKIVSDPIRMDKVRAKVIEILIVGSMAKENPRGVYTTYSAWRAAAKKAGAVRFEGDKDIAQAFDANGRGVAEWDGAEGYIYRKSEMRNPRNSGDDPSRDEMIEHIRKVYGREADEFDIEEAIYWFASDYHGGQGSNLYSALSMSEYRPGRSSSGPEEGSMAEMIYSDLVDTFSPKKNPVHSRKPKQRIAVCLSKSRKRNPVYDTGSDE